jgi:hypothetical protein
VAKQVQKQGKKGGHGTSQAGSKQLPVKIPKTLQPFIRNYPHELSAKLIQDTNDFVRNPPDIVDYKTFTAFFAGIAKCVLRNEVDEHFPFDTKTATTLAYVGTIIALGLDRAAKEAGILAGMQDRFDRLTAGPMALTLPQCAEILKQENRNSALLLIERFTEANKQADSIKVDITEVEPFAIQTHPVKESFIHDESEYAF